jgi:hypothetical protein
MTIEQLEIIKEQSECLFSEADVEDALMRMALEIEARFIKKAASCYYGHEWRADHNGEISK